MRVGLLALPAGVLISPGLWQVTVESEGAGQGASAAYEICLQSGDADDLRRFLPRLASQSQTCPQATSRIDAARLLWEFVCESAGVQASAEFALATDEVRGATLVRRAGAAPQYQRLSARRIGECR